MSGMGDRSGAKVPACGVRGRATLRVYLGAAPGVGKTYAMLREAHRLRAEHRDVVVGLVETHGRKETESQIDDLEVVPRRVMVHGGVVIEEMDLAAILDRRPEIVLVDELAHTNAPGSRHNKRYADVLDILAAGIGVITTMNVQHLESVHGLVASITGVDIREVVPDSVLDLAEDIQLVDLPVGALIDRLQAGKIYPAHRVDASLTGFFREGNLVALRELALRRTAEDVDDQLSDLMMVHGDGLVVASDRVLVLANGQAHWSGVVRAAWRLASALRGSLLVAALVPDGNPDLIVGTEGNALAQHLRLAEDLGAEVHLTPADSVSWPEGVDLLVDLIRLERISIVVLGVTTPLRRLFRPAISPETLLAQSLLKRVAGLEVHLISQEGHRKPDH